MLVPVLGNIRITNKIAKAAEEKDRARRLREELEATIASIPDLRPKDITHFAGFINKYRSGGVPRGTRSNIESRGKLSKKVRKWSRRLLNFVRAVLGRILSHFDTPPIETTATTRVVCSSAPLGSALHP